MKWTICIATVPARKDKLNGLMNRLIPQIKGKPIEVLIFFNNFEYSIGYIRQRLIEEAKGFYVSHIDDDDMVPDDYCATLLPLLDGIDYVGFKVRFIDNGKLMSPVFHSLKYKNWSQDDDGYYRGVTHLNPIKRTLALEAGFPIERNTGEDENWATRVNAQTEHFIDREMYEYRHVHNDSVAYAEDDKRNALIMDTFKPPDFRNQQVRLHPESTKC